MVEKLGKIGAGGNQRGRDETSDDVSLSGLKARAKTYTVGSELTI